MRKQLFQSQVKQSGWDEMVRQFENLKARMILSEKIGSVGSFAECPVSTFQMLRIG